LLITATVLSLDCRELFGGKTTNLAVRIILTPTSSPLYVLLRVYGTGTVPVHAKSVPIVGGFVRAIAPRNVLLAGLQLSFFMNEYTSFDTGGI